MGNKVLYDNKNMYENENMYENDYESENIYENQVQVESEDNYFNHQSIHESESIDSQDLNLLCPGPSTELETDDYISNEMLGFGANKKVYINLFYSF